MAGSTSRRRKALWPSTCDRSFSSAAPRRRSESASAGEAPRPDSGRGSRNHRGGALVAEESIRLSLLAALLGGGAASDDHPRSPEGDPRPEGGRSDLGGRPRDRLL